MTVICFAYWGLAGLLGALVVLSGIGATFCLLQCALSDDGYWGA